jgi:hypothetical protein
MRILLAVGSHQVHGRQSCYPQGPREERYPVTPTALSVLRAESVSASGPLYLSFYLAVLTLYFRVLAVCGFH